MLTPTGLSPPRNLADLASAATARANLGLGSAATTAATAYATAAQGALAATALQSVPAHSAALLTSGNVALAQLGTGSPAAGKYVDGASGVWTALPAGGGTIASTASVLKGDGSGNAVAATAGTDYAGLASANTFTSQQVLICGASGGTPLVVRQAGGTAGVNEVQLTHTGSLARLKSLAGGLTVSGPNTGSTTLLSVEDNNGNIFFQQSDSSNAVFRNGLQDLGGGNGFLLTSSGRWICQGPYDFRDPSGGGISAGLARSGSGVVQVTNGSTSGIGSLQYATAYLQQPSSTSTLRNAGVIVPTLATATDASWKGRLVLYAGDYTSSNAGQREGVRVESDGTQPLLAFFGASAVARPTVTGSRASGAALVSLLAALVSLGLIVDSTTT